MEQTTIIISNLSKNDFVAQPGKQISLAGQIKIALLKLTTADSDHELYQDVVNWTDLPFLNRIVVIFNNGASAMAAYRYLEGLYLKQNLFTLPPTVNMSLEENLLRKSKLTDALTEHTASTRESSNKFKSLNSAESD